MKKPERAEDYLDHIIEAIERATSYLEPLDNVTAFEASRRDQDAVLHNIAIIGEAAAGLRRVAPELLAAHGEIPWADMRAMRNFVVHAYFSVSPRVVWNTVKNDLPTLRQQILTILENP